MWRSSENEGDAVLFVTVFDQLPGHAGILHHLTIDRDKPITNVEGVVEEGPGLLIPTANPEQKEDE